MSFLVKNSTINSIDSLAEDKMGARGGLTVTTSYMTPAEEESALQELERLMDQGKDLNGTPTLSSQQTPVPNSSSGCRLQIPALDSPSRRFAKEPSDIKSPREPPTPCLGGDPWAVQGATPLSPLSPVSQSDKGSSVVDPEEQWLQRCNRPFFDIFTIRQWFMEMDSNRSGSVTKQEFIHFLRNRPRLRRLFIDAGKQRRQQYKGDATQITDSQAEALEMRRLLKLLKEIDEDGNGTLEFEEFLDFWRVSGFLLEYETPSNPREQIAAVLGQIQEGQGNDETDSPNLKSTVASLCKRHLSSFHHRKSLDLINATGEPQPGGESLRVAYAGVNRRCSEPIQQVGRMALFLRPQTQRGRRASDSSVCARMLTVE